MHLDNLMPQNSESRAYIFINKKMETIVQKLENYYSQYLKFTSNMMLNLNTDSLPRKIESLRLFRCKNAKPIIGAHVSYFAIIPFNVFKEKVHVIHKKL